MSYQQNGNWFRQIQRAFVFIRAYRGSVFVILGMTLAASALEVMEPLVLKYLFDNLGSGTLRALGIGVACLFAIGITRESINGSSNWLAWRVRLGLNANLMEATVGRLHSLPLAYHREESVGSIMTKLDRGINGFVGALAEMVFNILPAVVYLALSLIVMLRLDWRLSVVVLVFAPLPALIGMWAAGEQTQRERTLMDSWSKIFSRLNEVLSGILTVKSFVMEDEEKKKFLAGVNGANEVVLRGVATDTRVGAAKNLVTLLAKISSIALGGYLVYRHEVTIGTLIAFLGYVGGLFGPVQGLTGVYQTIRKATVSLDTIFSILDAHDHMCDAPDAQPVKALKGEVIYDRVSFSYHRNKPILQGINLCVEPGEIIALVGPSGAGKTTMMALLQRLYDPTAGTVYVDGMDIRKMKQRSLRRHIGVVFQEALLFNDTVKNNIAYGKPGACRHEIEGAAKAANIHEVIMRMAEGYETLIGERGSRLSGGEKQRVSIARAILKDPPILILDEATSSLDAESEALVREALAHLMTGRTTFIIAHRLSTVVGANRILVLRDGQITEAGNHAKLMELGGYYASLVKNQTRGLLDQKAA